MAAQHSFEVFDVHQHVGSTGDAHSSTGKASLSGAAVIDAEVANRIAFMDDSGIRQSVAIPGHHYDRADGVRATMRENDAIAAYRDANPERFPVAVGLIEPLDHAAALEEVDRIAGELGLQAVSFHTEYQAVTIDSLWMMRILERMFERGLVPLIHASDVVLHEALWRLAKVARAFPDQTIIAMEPFFTYDGLQQCELIAEIAPNVLFDTGSCRSIGPMIDLLATIGADRAVFGSQYYSQLGAYDPGGAEAHGKTIVASIVASERFTDDEKAAILGGNARRAFGL